MTKVIMAQGEPDTSAQSTANTTLFWACGAAGCSLDTFSATEANAQIKHKTAGTFSNFTFSLSANGISGGTSNFTFRINGADGNMTIPIPASGTGNFALASSTTTDSIVADDLTCAKFVPGAATGIITLKTMKVLFANTASSETITRLVDGGFPNGNFNTASTTVFEPIAGEMAGTFVTTESLAQCKMRKPGTIRNLGFFVQANARSTNTTVFLRKNATNTTITKVVAGGATGWQEDTTHTVSIVANDLLDWSIATSTGTGAFRVTAICCDFVTTDGWFPVITGTTDAITTAAGLTRFQTLGGFLNPVTSETNHDMIAQSNYNFAELTANATTNGIAAVSSVTFRVNAADSALIASTTASTAGQINDSTHTVIVGPGDTMDHKVLTGGASGNLKLTSIIVWGQEIVVPQTVMVEWEEG